MKPYSDEELIIIGRYHALRLARKDCMDQININHLSMRGMDLTCHGESTRMLELLEAQTGLVQAFQDLESEYQPTLKTYRNMVSEQVQDNE